MYFYTIIYSIDESLKKRINYDLKIRNLHLNKSDKSTKRTVICLKTHVRRKKYILILLVIMITIAVTIPAFSLYGYIKDVVINEIGKNAANTSKTIAEFIEQDLDSYKKLYESEEYKEGTYDKVYYDKMHKLFNSLIKQTGAKYIYTEKRVSDDEIVYILDATGQILGIKEKMSDLKIKTYNSEAPIHSGLIADKIWGAHCFWFHPHKRQRNR